VAGFDIRTSGPSRDVGFQSGDITLAGTYVDVVDPSASALILAGSGKLDRDSNNRRFRGGVSKALADALEDHGVASLRYDKRGAGASQGDFLSCGMSDNYADARAALSWLAAQLPNVPLFVIGHSEGALHSARLAADEAEVAGAVLIACAARKGEEILVWQAEQIVPTLPRTSKAILKLLHIDPLKSQRKAFERIRSTSADVVRIQGRRLNARWLREFLDYDPAPVFGRVPCPVLAVVGEHDLQVPPEDTARIAQLVQGPCEVHVIDDLSHILRRDPDARGPRDYRRALHERVSPVLLDLVADWVADQAKA
jgi:pimeloyl-ACP methyl ester carboxylesterase